VNIQPIKANNFRFSVGNQFEIASTNRPIVIKFKGLRALMTAF